MEHRLILSLPGADALRCFSAARPPVPASPPAARPGDSQPGAVAWREGHERRPDFLTVLLRSLGAWPA